MPVKRQTLKTVVDKARTGWMKSQMAKAAAHADRVLMTDEELPLSASYHAAYDWCVFCGGFYLGQLCLLG